MDRLLSTLIRMVLRQVLRTRGRGARPDANVRLARQAGRKTRAGLSLLRRFLG